MSSAEDAPAEAKEDTPAKQEDAPAEAKEDTPAKQEDTSAKAQDAAPDAPDAQEDGEGLGFAEDTTPAEPAPEVPEEKAAEPPKPVFLAGRKFCNRAEVLEHVKKIQEKVAEDDGSKGELSNEDNLFIFHLLLHHPKAVEKMTSPISHFRYGIYDKFKNKCFISVRVDGSQEGVSAAKSVEVIFPKSGASGAEGSGGAGLAPGAVEQRGKKREREEKKEAEPRVFQPEEMVKGVVLDIKGLPPRVNYQRLKEQLGEFGKVRFLQLLRPPKTRQGDEPAAKKAKVAEGEEGEEGEEDDEEEEEEEEEEQVESLVTGRCRFMAPEVAAAALTGLAEAEVQGAQVETVLLTGAEEEAYWEETNRKMKEAFENPNPDPKGKGKKGKGKGKGKGKDFKGKGKGKKGGKRKGGKSKDEEGED